MFTEFFMVMKYVYIGLIPSTFFPITMLDNTLPHQYPLKILSLGVGIINDSKQSSRMLIFIYIKIILIIIIQACHHTLFVVCPYCMSTFIYVTYGVSHHLHIPYVGDSYRPPHSCLPCSMYTNQITPDFRSSSPRRVTDHRRNMRNRR